MQVLDYDGTDHLVDKIYDLINSGGSADYIVEEGQDGPWYYRKWASGISECWAIEYSLGSCAMTSKYGNAWYVTKSGYTFPRDGNGNRIFISNPYLNISCRADSGLVNASIYFCSKDSYNFYLYDMQSETKTVYIDVYAKGFWKTFTPSVSAKAQVGFEDLTSQVISGTSMYTISTDDTRAYRIGNLLFMNVRGIVNTAQTQAINIPWVKVPISIHANLTGIVTINGSPTYPVVRVGTVNGAQYLYQAITSNISANSSLWFSFIAVIKPT